MLTDESEITPCIAQFSRLGAGVFRSPLGLSGVCGFQGYNCIQEGVVLDRPGGVWQSLSPQVDKLCRFRGWQ